MHSPTQPDIAQISPRYLQVKQPGDSYIRTLLLAAPALFPLLAQSPGDAVVSKASLAISSGFSHNHHHGNNQQL
jgi:hypothetical protein